MRKSAVILGLIVTLTGTGACASGRPFTARDTVQIETFDRENYNPVSPSSQESVFVLSGDGKRVVFVTTRGVAENDALRSTLWCMEIDSIRAYMRAPSRVRKPAPREIAVLEAAASRAPIDQPTWLKDDRTVGFIGIDETGSRRLFTVDVTSKSAPQAHSLSGRDVNLFAQTPQGWLIADSATLSREELYQAIPQGNEDIVGDTSGRDLFTLLFPRLQDEINTIRGFPENRLWRLNSNRASALAGGSTGEEDTGTQLLSVSPDGQWVVITEPVPALRPQWTEYKAVPGQFFYTLERRDRRDEPLSEWPQHYRAINLTDASRGKAIDAPLARYNGYFASPRATWSPNSKTVILEGTYPVADFQHVRADAVTPCVLKLQVETGLSECIASYAVDGKPGDGVVGLRARLAIDWKPDAATPKWSVSDITSRRVLRIPDTRHGASASEALQIFVDEAVNRSAVVAVRLGSRRAVQLFDPNPQLRQIDMGEAKTFVWTDSTGLRREAGLVFPPDFTPGKRYPLIVQGHGYDPGRFLVDGIMSSGNAARVVAARGFLVIQLSEPAVSMASGRSNTQDVDFYRSVIRALDGEGLIDPKRVGAIAFSFTGAGILKTLVRAPELFSAVVFAESDSFSYSNLMLTYQLLGSRLSPQYIAQEWMGSVPFGAGLEEWVRMSPGFHLDRVRAPVQFQEYSPAALIGSWPVYAGLRMLNKPADLFYIRRGQHDLSRPSHRIASQEATAAWFEYWILHRLDSDASKQDRYLRWDKLRAASAGLYNGAPFTPPSQNK